MKLKSPYLIKPRAEVKLSRLPTAETGDFKNPEAATSVLVKHRDKLTQLQDLFYASQQKALLIVLQGMDTAGKDGTISHIFSGINPQGCAVTCLQGPHAPRNTPRLSLARPPGRSASRHDRNLQPLSL